MRYLLSDERQLYQKRGTHWAGGAEAKAGDGEQGAAVHPEMRLADQTLETQEIRTSAKGYKTTRDGVK